MGMSDKREHGLSLIEVLISASLFTIVILGISQSVLLMHRYSRANLCKYKAHLIATSYFESLLCDTHPYELNKNTVILRHIDNPSATDLSFFYDVAENIDGAEKNDDEYTHLNTFTTSTYDDGNNDLKVFMLLTVQESPLCKVYKKNEAEADSIANSKARQDIIPPEGFQSLRLYYWYTSPFMTTTPSNEDDKSITFLNGLEKDQLYAIRPINPDDPEYDV